MAKSDPPSIPCTVHTVIEGEGEAAVFPYRCERCWKCLVCGHKLNDRGGWVCGDGFVRAIGILPGLPVARVREMAGRL